MQEISINPHNINECDLKGHKVRLISVEKNEILLCHYSKYLMLPGGKVDNGETEEEAIIREIKEETGVTLQNEDLIPLVITKSKMDNYKSRSKEDVTSKETITTYFITNKPITPNDKSNLSAREKKDNFYFERITIPELINIISRTVKDSKELIYNQELLAVLKFYLQQHKLIDLHTHTFYSDGQYSPDEVIRKAQENNVDTIAITDHDTVLGLKTIDYQQYTDILVIPGIELTAKVPKGRMHILGYNIDYNNQNLNKALEEIHTNNINNLKNIVEYLKLFNITLPEDELNEIYTRIGNIGRPDIAKLLIKHGYVTTVKEAFDCYLVEAFNKIRHKNKGLKYPEILKLIIDANGIPVLAHPKSLELSNDELDELIKHMVSLGLKGIETIHSDITSKEHVFYMQLVDKYHLTYSGGSDYHGEQVKPDIELGHGRNNIYIEEVSVLNLIKKH